MRINVKSIILALVFICNYQTVALSALSEREARLFDTLYAEWIKNSKEEDKALTNQLRGNIKTLDKKDVAQYLLDEYYQSVDGMKKSFAIQMYHDLADREGAYQMALDGLKDENDDVRLTSVHLLGAYKDKIYVDELLDLIKNEKSTATKYLATVIVSGYINHPGVLEMLAGEAESNDAALSKLVKQILEKRKNNIHVITVDEWLRMDENTQIEKIKTVIDHYYEEDGILISKPPNTYQQLLKSMVEQQAAMKTGNLDQMVKVLALANQDFISLK